MTRHRVVVVYGTGTRRSLGTYPTAEAAQRVRLHWRRKCRRGSSVYFLVVGAER